jgi:hypothetical protein
VHLTRGEKLALLCFVPILVGFLPPVTAFAAAVQTRVLGLPFLLFWNSLMVALTAVLMSLAFAIKNRVDSE